MSFQAPLFLLGLVSIPLVLLALWAARRRPARYVVRFPAAATLAAVVGRTGRARRIIPPALLCLALAGLVTALARPEATIAVPVERASVMLVTDTSGSMNATDVAPSRLAAAQAAAHRFLDRVPKSLQTGLVAYADGPHTVLRPTQDREQVEATVQRAARRRRDRHRRRARERAERARRAWRQESPGGDRAALRRRVQDRP